jgi:hypothetical protein
MSPVRCSTREAVTVTISASVAGARTISTDGAALPD